MEAERRGFAGFDSLVTDLTDLPPPPPPRVPPPPPPPPPPADKPLPPPANRPAGQGRPATGPPRPASKQKVVAVAALFVGAIALAGVGFIANSRRPPPSPAPGRPGSTTPSANPVPRFNPTPLPQFNPTPPPQFNPTLPPRVGPIPSPLNAEEKPPVGQDRALSVAQLRYCLAQSARLDGGEKAVDRKSQSDIGRFNALVEDYNLRCVKYRYRPSEMQSVKAEVDARRAQLEREGAALIRQAGSR